MGFRRKMYPCVFKKHTLKSAIAKKDLNITLIGELREIVNDINKRKRKLHLYWYNLKHFVYALHGAYRLLYKILHTFGSRCISTMSEHHHIIYGPRPIEENIIIFRSMVQFISLQLEYIETVVRFKLNVKMHDTISLLFTVA